MVDDPARQLFKEGAVWVHEHRLLVLHCFVAALTESGSVIEITSRDSLEDKKEAGRENMSHNIQITQGAFIVVLLDISKVK